MRLECIFCKSCRRHVGPVSEQCRNCGHGACWHTLNTTQFHSDRPYAAVALYNWERVLPQVPPLPYCETVVKLPV